MGSGPRGVPTGGSGELYTTDQSEIPITAPCSTSGRSPDRDTGRAGRSPHAVIYRIQSRYRCLDRGGTSIRLPGSHPAGRCKSCRSRRRVALGATVPDVPGGSGAVSGSYSGRVCRYLFTGVPRSPRVRPDPPSRGSTLSAPTTCSPTVRSVARLRRGYAMPLDRCDGIASPPSGRSGGFGRLRDAVAAVRSSGSSPFGYIETG